MLSIIQDGKDCPPPLVEGLFFLSRAYIYFFFTFDNLGNTYTKNKHSFMVLKQ